MSKFYQQWCPDICSKVSRPKKIMKLKKSRRWRLNGIKKMKIMKLKKSKNEDLCAVIGNVRHICKCTFNAVK